jgi:hypothetical protein
MLAASQSIRTRPRFSHPESAATLRIGRLSCVGYFPASITMKISAVTLCLLPALASAFAPAGIQVSI